MSNAPITMQQLANDLGLNRATVSLIINGHAKKRRLSEKTVQRVQHYMKKVGYVPSRAALALRSDQQNRVGILHSAPLYSHLLTAFRSLVDHFSEDGVGAEVVVCSEDKVLEGLRDMVGRGVQRVVWLRTAGQALLPEFCDETLALGSRLRPVIYNYGFDLTSDEKNLLAHGFSLVGVSRTSCFNRMAAFLRDLGHRSVLLPDLESDTGCSHQEHLLTQTMQNRGLSVIFSGDGETDDSIFSPLDRSESQHLVERGRFIGSRVAELFRAGGGFTAVCFRDDEVAAGAMSEMLRCGVKIPDDLTVVSMDGHPLGDVFPVPLTTLAIPVKTMVEKSVALATGKGDSIACRCRYRLLMRASHASPGKRVC